MADNFKTYLETFAGVNNEELILIGERVTLKTFPKSRFLQQKGDICRFSFFVEKGLLRMYSIDPLGKEHIIQFAPENWFVSDRGSVFFNEPTEYYIDAVEDTTVVVLDELFMNQASEISVAFRKHNERLLHNHIRHLQKRISLLIGAGAEERYRDFVSMYPDVHWRVPQWMVASFLGITPESLSRVRRELARKV